MALSASVDLKELEKRLCSPSKAFLSEGALHKADGLLIHKDRGSKVLGVAHLDFVGGVKPAMSYATTKKGARVVWNERLDDRLGAYILLDYLPKLGVELDVLLTDNEEIGNSTGGDFVSPKDYNWMVMFDRAGTDLVMYQYETKRLREMVEKFGFKVGVGSYSCIAKMEQMGVSGFNIGTGYYLNHGPRGYSLLDDVETQVEKFVGFFHQHKDEKLKHEGREYYGGYRGNGYKPFCRDDDKEWVETRHGYWSLQDKKKNQYGSLDSQGTEPVPLEKDILDMSDDEFREYMGMSDAAYWRMKEQYQ